MSRIGKQPITVPSGTTITVGDRAVTVKGPKGTLLLEGIQRGIVIREKDGTLEILDETNDALRGSAFRGLYRSLIANMVTGATTGYTRILDFIGVGYRCAVEGDKIKLEVGYSMPKYLVIPTGITAVVEKNTILTLTGADKHALGQFAADIRKLRPPEPYKGKGIKYREEKIRRKAGKAGGK